MLPSKVMANLNFVSILMVFICPATCRRVRVNDARIRVNGAIDGAIDAIDGANDVIVRPSFLSCQVVCEMP